MSVAACLLASRDTLRHAGRAKAFYLSAILTLAVGMTGATLVFTLVRGVLLRPLPMPDEERLVVSWRVPRSGLEAPVPYRSQELDDIAGTSRSFDRIAGIGYNGVFQQTWRIGNATVPAKTAAVTGAFFDVAGVLPQLGRALGVQDDRRGAERCVLLSHSAWVRLFAGSPAAPGQTLYLGDYAFRVAGVMPQDFDFPRGTEVWTTLHALAETETNEEFRLGLLRDVNIVGRLRQGVSGKQAEDEIATAIAALEARQPSAGGAGFRPVVRPLKSVIVGETAGALLVLFAAVSLLLVVAGAHVANLLLMRGESRRGEFAIRTALGAAPSRLVAQVLSESLLISVTAATLGLALSIWGLQAIVALAPDGLPRPDAIRIDVFVIVVATAAAFVVAAGAGVLPALSASRADVVERLRVSGRGLTSARSRGRRAFVALQMALAVTVLAGAGLLARSLARLQTVQTGITNHELVFAEFDLPSRRYSDQTRRAQFFEALLERARSVPGVDAAAPLNTGPFSGTLGWDLPQFTAEGQTAERVRTNPSLNFEAVHPAYFSALGVTLVRGRPFSDADRRDAPRVAIVSDTLAADLWPGEDPVGKRLKFGGIDASNEWLAIVGVARTTRYRDLMVPRPTLYVPAEQLMVAFDRMAIRTTRDSVYVARLINEIARDVDPTVRVTRVAPYAEYARVPLAWPRFNTLMLGVFAAAAVLLSAIGLFAVMATAVRQRQGEIGVRLAVGATPADIQRLVLGEGLRSAIAGAAGGLALMFASTRLLRSLLFETSPLDPLSLAVALLTLIAAAAAATWLPARRATTVNPIEVLRQP